MADNVEGFALWANNLSTEEIERLDASHNIPHDNPKTGDEICLRSWQQLFVDYIAGQVDCETAGKQVAEEAWNIYKTLLG